MATVQLHSSCFFSFYRMLNLSPSFSFFLSDCSTRASPWLLSRCFIFLILCLPFMHHVTSFFYSVPLDSSFWKEHGFIPSLPAIISPLNRCTDTPRVVTFSKNLLVEKLIVLCLQTLPMLSRVYFLLFDLYFSQIEGRKTSHDKI